MLANPDFDAADGWSCACGRDALPTACVTVATADGGHALELGTHCFAYQDVAGVDPTRTLTLAVDATASGWARAFLAGWTAEDLAVEPPDPRVRNTTRRIAATEASPASARADGWATLAGTEPLDTDDLALVRVVLANDTAAPVRFDDVAVVAGDPNPPPFSRSRLVRAEHREAAVLRAGRAPVSWWTPLPMDAAGQVPLDVSLAITPADVPREVHPEVDALGNPGVTVTFPAEAAATTIELDWTAILLVAEPARADRPAFYARDDDPARWLGATAIVEADHAPLRRVAATLGADTPLATLTRLVKWTREHVSAETWTPSGRLPDLDAATVFDGAPTSCTGYANVAAALGRAAGLPTRIVAGILVGRPQTMHYVDEAWLGDDLGWRRFEPQGHTEVGEAYLVAMRRVLPEDEGAGALARGRRFAAPGVPLRAIREWTGDVRRVRWAPPARPFEGCDECEQDARVVATLGGDPVRVRAAFDEARRAWRARGGDWVSGRDGAAAIASLDDLARWLTPAR